MRTVDISHRGCLGQAPAVNHEPRCAWVQLSWAQVVPCVRYWEPSTLSIHANGSRISSRVGRLSGASHARLSSVMP